ncbi:MAG: trxA [Chlamydiales bacterium]|nr:trxA [Chlamydiales bacterium]
MPGLSLPILACKSFLESDCFLFFVSATIELLKIFIYSFAAALPASNFRSFFMATIRKANWLIPISSLAFLLAMPALSSAAENSVQLAGEERLQVLTDETFKVTEQGMWVVDFYAEWCGPCKRFEPVFKQVAEEMLDYRFAKVNTDRSPLTSQGLNIKMIPTIVVFKEGKEVGRQEGSCDLSALKKFILKNLSP